MIRAKSNDHLLPAYEHQTNRVDERGNELMVLMTLAEAEPER